MWKKQLKDFNKPLIEGINYSLFNLNKIGEILKLQKIKFNKPVDCNIAVDAAVFNPINGSKIIKRFDFF